jgi:hypothetical protein
MDLLYFEPLTQSILDFFAKAEKQFQTDEQWENFIHKALKIFKEDEFDILDKVYAKGNVESGMDYLHYYSYEKPVIMKWVYKLEEFKEALNQI